MRESNYPRLVSDPDPEGLPWPAGDDSTAWDDVDTGREADGADPAVLPSDVPLAVDRYGATAEEQRRGESIDDKLAREEPDLTAAAHGTRKTPSGGRTVDDDRVGEATTTDPAPALQRAARGLDADQVALGDPQPGGVCDADLDPYIRCHTSAISSNESVKGRRLATDAPGSRTGGASIWGGTGNEGCGVARRG
jgi:hypothetical protein